jgi:ArsR family transcriptional regulator
MTPPLIERQTADDIAEKLRSLANPTRLRILAYLASGERSVGEIEQGLSLKQPGLSQQLADLRQAGWVTTRRQAKSIFYRLANRNISRLIVSLETLLADDEVEFASLVSALSTPDPHPVGGPAPPQALEAAVFALAGRQAARRRA